MNPWASWKDLPNWDQPHRDEILFDDSVAVMSEKTFLELKEYSATNPSEVFSWKMWKAHRRDNDTWFLCWYEPASIPNHCIRKHCPIQIMDWKALMGV